VIYILKEDIKEALKKWSRNYSVFVPDRQGSFVLFGPEVEINWKIVPVWQGVKEFVYPPRYQVTGENKKILKPILLVGVRNCDIRALSIVMDTVFLKKEPLNPVFERLRKNVKIVSMDCNNPAETCFCMSVGGDPYPEDGFDLNLSFVGNDLFIQTGSDEGNRLMKEIESDEAGKKGIEKIKDMRETIQRKQLNNVCFEFEKDRICEKISDNYDKKYWAEKSKNCIQCGGCNFSCPTCYCSILNEVSDKEDIKKILQWDSCRFPGYARMAGGRNPREELWQRFRYRYLCKFTLMVQEFGVPGCTGCGRCIQVCPGKIDIRKTIKGLYEQRAEESL